MTTVSLSLGKKGEDTSSTRMYMYVVLSFQTHFTGQFPAQRARAALLVAAATPGFSSSPGSYTWPKGVSTGF